jgi:hypothetical protein
LQRLVHVVPEVVQKSHSKALGVQCYAGVGLHGGCSRQFHCILVEAWRGGEALHSRRKVKAGQCEVTAVSEYTLSHDRIPKLKLHSAHGPLG